ncbi:protein kinase family protein [Clostridium sp. 19966]|uniref:Serine/threonine-protein kinase PrkC n=1 Tax=Clostridium butyricum TaxID=1492 RepID=A0A6N3A1E0_CLOBU|nr:protein kinase family protein [Clostridium sp. 19966]MDT8717013.1 protein kinase family protein [Clostridium sp. 19966]
MWFCKTLKYSGKVVGTYTIEEPIGEGRYGLCFLARSNTGEKVIIKKFKPTLFKRNSDKNAYEAVILSKLKDKRIPELLGVINEKGFYGFVLEFKEGFTVKELLFKRNHKFTMEEFFNIGIQLISIIRYLHENGIVHRDIRIPNVLINDGKVNLLDFGLSRWANNDNYPYDLDFSYLGDFFLYLLYSSFEPKVKRKNLPWYKELLLTSEQILFLKKLLGIELMYKNIKDIEADFIKAFAAGESSF